MHQDNETGNLSFIYHPRILTFQEFGIVLRASPGQKNCPSAYNNVMLIKSQMHRNNPGRLYLSPLIKHPWQQTKFHGKFYDCKSTFYNDEMELVADFGK